MMPEKLVLMLNVPTRMLFANYIRANSSMVVLLNCFRVPLMNDGLLELELELGSLSTKIQ